MWHRAAIERAGTDPPDPFDIPTPPVTLFRGSYAQTILGARSASISSMKRSTHRRFLLDILGTHWKSQKAYRQSRAV